MRTRLGLVVVLALSVVVAMAGAASARPYLERGDAAKSTSAQTVEAGSTSVSTTSGDAAGSVDPSGSAKKKGKGYCIGASDGDKITCPSHKKASKKGKGYEIG